MAKRTASASKKTTASAQSPGMTQVAAKNRGDGSVTREQIAARAYEIYRDRCRTRQPGDAASDWVKAEGELRAGGRPLR